MSDEKVKATIRDIPGINEEKIIKTLDDDTTVPGNIVQPNHVLLYGTTAFVSLGALLFGKHLRGTLIQPIGDLRLY